MEARVVTALDTPALCVLIMGVRTVPVFESNLEIEADPVHITCCVFMRLRMYLLIILEPIYLWSFSYVSGYHRRIKL